MLHAMLANPKISRLHLEPEQFETVAKAESMATEFINGLKIEPGHGYGAIIQPRISDKAFAVRYTPQNLKMARAEILDIWEAAHKKDAPRRASPESCQFCQAKALCPEYKAFFFAIEKISHIPAAQWSAEQWDLFLTRRRELTKFLEDRYEDAKRIKAANPDALPGWELRQGKQRRVIDDIISAWKALESEFDAAEFSVACKLSASALETILWQKHAGMMSQASAKWTVNRLLGNLITLKQDKPSLVKKEP